jgi:hypothetical protein
MLEYADGLVRAGAQVLIFEFGYNNHVIMTRPLRIEFFGTLYYAVIKAVKTVGIMKREPANSKIKN